LPTPGSAKGSPSPYRLPGPLSSRGDLPVAPSAPRIPRALRAFNGMTPPPDETDPATSPDVHPAAAPRVQPPARAGRPREPLTIRDLLEEPATDAGDERFAGLRTALRRLLHGRGAREED
jgi:hypothetical protein